MATVAGAGISRAEDAVAAGRDAGRQARAGLGGGPADWAVVFATFAHRPRFSALLAAVMETLGTDELSGCSAWGVLARGEEIEGRPGVAVLAVRSDRVAGRAILAPAGDDERGEAAREVARVLTGPPSEGLLLLFPDPFAIRIERLLADLEGAAPGLLAVGGAASGDPSGDASFQFYGRNVATRSLSALRLSGALRVTLGVTQGCQPLGEPCRITRASANVIAELDGRPALGVLQSRLPAALRDSIQRLSGHLFVALPPDPAQTRFEPGEYLVRALLAADPERGALAIGSPVEEGQRILFALREGQAARDDLKQMIARLGDPRDRGDRFGLYFNCAARGTPLYGMPGIDSAYLTGALGEIPLAGFFGNAEIAPLRGANRLFTHTGVLALVGEAP
jgi:small ligand-binding sensory domain FIST